MSGAISPAASAPQIHTNGAPKPIPAVGWRASPGMIIGVLGALLAIGVVIAWAVWKEKPAPTARPTNQKQQSASLGASTAGNVEAGVQPVLVLDQTELIMVEGASGDAQMTMRVDQAAAGIKSIVLEDALTPAGGSMSGLEAIPDEGAKRETMTPAEPFSAPSLGRQTSISAFVELKDNCPRSPSMMPVGSACSITVRYNGGAAPQGRVVVYIQSSSGVSQISTSAALVPRGRENPPQQAEPAVPVARIVPEGPSMQEAYLVRRSRSAIPSTSFGGTTRAVSTSRPYAEWDAIGVEATESSLPVDMSRTITPDRPIPAVLVYPIDSGRAVTAVAQVDRDVYGAADRRILLPRGTRILGRVAGAGETLGIQWVQIIRPDGVRFAFEGEVGDAMGRGGVPGRTRARLFERYGWSALTSGITAGLTVALGGRQTTTTGAGQSTETKNSRAVAADVLRAELGRINSDLASKGAAIQPEITVPAGTRITVWALTDLRLKPIPPRTPTMTIPSAEGFGSGGTQAVTSRDQSPQEKGTRANYLPGGVRVLDDIGVETEQTTGQQIQQRGAGAVDPAMGLTNEPQYPSSQQDQAQQTDPRYGGIRPTKRATSSSNVPWSNR